MNFHDKYIRVNKWYEQAEFKLTNRHITKTGIVGFDYDDEDVKLDIYGNLTSKAGFYFGASGPTWDTKSSREASCLHDALYWISQNNGFIRTYDGHIPNDKAIKMAADSLLYNTAIKNGMYRWRACMWLTALHQFGGNAWNSEPNK